VLLPRESPTATGVVAAILAAALAIVAGTIPPGERAYGGGRLRVIVIVAAVPGLWLIFRLVPLASLGLSHQIWSCVEAALGRATWGSISIDVGTTAVVLCRYLCAVGVLLLAATLTADRRRAEWGFLVLVVATTAIAVMPLIDDMTGVGLLERWDGSAARVRAIDCAALGLILAAAWAVRTLERGYTRRAQPYPSGLNLALALAAFVC